MEEERKEEKRLKVKCLLRFRFLRLFFFFPKMSPSDKAVNFLDKKSYTGRDKIATSWDKKAIVRIKWEEIKTKRELEK